VGRIAADLTDTAPAMRHITPDRLSDIDALLAELRRVDGLQERSPGVFYVRSRAFLHFHEDGDDVYADVRLDGDEFDRRRVTTRREQKALLGAVRRALHAG
jgi:hypothetical protein